MRLQAGNAEIILAPEIGGGIAALRFARHDALRPASAECLARGDPLGLSEFPMAPFVNRLAGNGFPWQGRHIALSGPHASTQEVLHGIAWRAPWRIITAQSDRAVLEMQHAPSPAWPFAFTAQRRFFLSASALTVEMRVTAGGATGMPAALGFHPYFPAAGAAIEAETAAAWVTNAQGIPQSLAMIAASSRLRAGAAVADFALDHCFTGWDGVVRLRWPSHALILRAAPNPGFLQIYTPLGAEYFCVEPQTAMPDAFNRAPGGSGITCLAPGESLDLALEVQFMPAGV